MGWRATYRGDHLGWYATAAEAERAIETERERQRKIDQDWNIEWRQEVQHGSSGL